MDEKIVLQEEDIQRSLVRIAHEIAERNTDASSLAIVGIHRRGAVLAARLKELLDPLLRVHVPLGQLDISFYRDDVVQHPHAPVLHASNVPFDVTHRTVVIVDDVLCTGRTVRAAIDALFDYGRPRRVQLAVLADRGHRELPIRPDYVGKNLPTSRTEHVRVRVGEFDGVEHVAIQRARAHAPA
ncbi:MAG: bifunctional pyr operon transcriptional regulator/uracil phosphoribosyltransferase PyrR [Solirubrobacteraceae bacterium]